MKQSAWLKQWRRRYFLLKDSKLFFCENEFSTPHGMINLAQCTTVESAEHKVGKKYSIELSTQDTKFYMHAESEKEKDEWIGAIRKAIVQDTI